MADRKDKRGDRGVTDNPNNDDERGLSRVTNGSVRSSRDIRLATTAPKRSSRSVSPDEDPRRYTRRNASNRYRNQRKKGARKRTILLTVVIVIVACIGVATAVAASYVNKINSSMVIDKSDSMYDALQPSSDSASAQDPFYMLLMGTDESAERDEEDIYGGAYRSDSIILARIDPKAQTVTLVSIHRDTVVDLSAYGGTGTDKINSAYVYGGKELMINTVSAFAGVPITHYAEIDFDGFEAVVNALGGVDVNVEMTFYDPYLEDGLDAGEQTLNGYQALLYARARHAFDDIGDGDRYRAKHQREVITAIAHKLLSSNVSTMASTISTLAQYIQTDMDVATIVSIAQSFVGVDPDKCFYSCMEPTESSYTDGVWYEYVDKAGWAEMMAIVDAGGDPGGDSAAGEDSTSSTVAASTTTSTGTTTTAVCTVSVKNGSEISGAASQAASTLTASGYSVVDTGDADASDYANTLVIYSDSAHASQAQSIADALGYGTVMASNGEYSFDSNVLVVIGGDWQS